MTGGVSRRGKRNAHLSVEHALDYPEGRLDAAAMQAVEEHLASPCGACHERVRDVSRLLEHMRMDRVPEVPDELRRRAIDLFEGSRRLTEGPSVIEKLARLLFDSAIH